MNGQIAKPAPTALVAIDVMIRKSRRVFPSELLPGGVIVVVVAIIYLFTLERWGPARSENMGLAPRAHVTCRRTSSRRTDTTGMSHMSAEKSRPFGISAFVAARASNVNSRGGSCGEKAVQRKL
jgi:hypothetical protein